MATVHSVHQALTKCTSQQCCQVMELTALISRMRGYSKPAGGKLEIAVVLRNYQKTLYRTQSLNGDFESLA